MARRATTSDSALRGDLFGGVTAAVIALPLALAFGVAAYAPLGIAHAPAGALAGLLGAIFTGFFAALAGGTPVQITGPTGPITVVVTSFMTSAVLGRPPEEIPVVIALAGIAIVLAGCLQIVIGALGGGRLVRYIPYPVVAGFMNGIAVIILLIWSDLSSVPAGVPLLCRFCGGRQPSADRSLAAAEDGVKGRAATSEASCP